MNSKFKLMQAISEEFLTEPYPDNFEDKYHHADLVCGFISVTKLEWCEYMGCLDIYNIIESCADVALRSVK